MADAVHESPGNGRPVYKPVSVDALRFDPQNPRLGGAAKRKSQDEIQKYLEGPPHYALQLEGSIVENGFLPYEPLIVRQQDENFVVIEGNRHLAAVRSIRADEHQKYAQDVKDRLSELPVLVFADSAKEADTEEELRYLGVKHLFGFRDWPPLSKAMFLDERIRSKRDMEQVLRELNITRQEVARYLIPFRLRKAAKRAFRKVNTEDFWSLAESFSRKNIRAYIQLDVDRRTMKIKFFDPGKLRHLAHFLYGDQPRVVTDTRQLSLLSKALSSTAAAKKLENGAPLDEALLYVEPKRETIANLQAQLERILQRIRMLSPTRDERQRLVGLFEEFASKLSK
jgi:hypothetical protein